MLNVVFFIFFSPVHVGSVRQTATIITMTEEHLRTGDKALCRFRFIKNPEYLKTDMRMVFREGRTKAVGNITKLFPHVSATAQNTRHQRATKKSQDIKHSVNPQNEPQKASKRNRRSRKNDIDDGESKETAAASSSAVSSPRSDDSSSLASCSAAAQTSSSAASSSSSAAAAAAAT